MTHSIGPTPAEAPAARAPAGRRRTRPAWPARLLAASAAASALAASPLLRAAEPEAPPMSGQTDAAAIHDDVPAAPDKGRPAPGKENYRPKLQSALTLVTTWGPDYMGSSHQGLGVRPGFLLRYGRWTLSSNGSFAANPDKDENQPRGLTFNTFGDDNDWVRVSLRVDSGRRSKDTDGLRGIDDVPRTIRMRVSGHIALGDSGWGVTPGVNIDLLNRGVGHTFDMNLSKDWRLAPKWKLTTNTGLTVGSGQYMRSYFGVTPEESAASGYRVYRAKAGLRDVWVGTGIRYDISPRWVATANVSAQRLLGSAEDAPMTQSRTNWGASAGVGWRF